MRAEVPSNHSPVSALVLTHLFDFIVHVHVQVSVLRAGLSPVDDISAYLSLAGKCATTLRSACKTYAHTRIGIFTSTCAYIYFILCLSVRAHATNSKVTEQSRKGKQSVRGETLASPISCDVVTSHTEGNIRVRSVQGIKKPCS